MSGCVRLDDDPRPIIVFVDQRDIDFVVEKNTGGCAKKSSTRSTSKPSAQLQQQSAFSENFHRRQLVVHGVIARAAFDHAHAPAPACSRACVFLVVLCLLCLFFLASRLPATPSAGALHGPVGVPAHMPASPAGRMMAAWPAVQFFMGPGSHSCAGEVLPRCGAAVAVRIRCVSCADPRCVSCADPLR